MDLIDGKLAYNLHTELANKTNKSTLYASLGHILGFIIAIFC